jgi:hypothetical protein
MTAIKGNWKPREEYRTLAEEHRPILARCKPNGQSLPAGPMVVIWSDRGSAPGGHFYPCPTLPLHWGPNPIGFLVHDHFDEWMEIPE